MQRLTLRRLLALVLAWRKITSVRSELDLVAPVGLNSADNGRSRARAEFYD